jgi:hypothetical protein
MTPSQSPTIRGYSVKFLCAISLCAALSGCTAAPKPVPGEVRVDDLHPGMTIKFFSGGKELAPVRVVEEGVFRTWRFTAEGSLRGDRYVPPEITARILFPCGWREMALRPRSMAWEVVAANAKVGTPFPLDFELPDLPDRPMDIRIDDRGGKEGELAIGQATYRVAPNTPEPASFVPGCAEGAAVRFNGVEMVTFTKAQIDAIPPGPDKTIDAGDTAYVFIDPTGERCYDLRTVYYLDPRLISPGAQQPKPTRLSGKHIYVLPGLVTNMLEHSPTAIMGEYSGERRELVEVKCH